MTAMGLGEVPAVPVEQLGLPPDLEYGLVSVVGPDLPGVITQTLDDGTVRVPQAGVYAGLLYRLPDGFHGLVADVVKRWGDEVAARSMELGAACLESHPDVILRDWAEWVPQTPVGVLHRALRLTESLLREKDYERWEVGVAILLEQAENEVGPEFGSVLDALVVAFLGAVFQIRCQLAVLEGPPS